MKRERSWDPTPKPAIFNAANSPAQMEELAATPIPFGPEIPELKRKEEEERKGGALPLIAGSGARSASLSNGGLALCARGAGPSLAARSGWRGLLGVHPSWFAGLGLLITGAGLLLSQGFFSFWNAEDRPNRLAAFPGVSEPMRDALGSAPKSDGSSLDMFLTANLPQAEAAELAEPVAAPEEPEIIEIPEPQPALPLPEKKVEEKKAWPAVARLVKNDAFKQAAGGVPGGMMGSFEKQALARPGNEGFFRGASAAAAKAEPIKAQRSKIPAGNMRTLSGRSNRAMGQLKLAQNLSNRGNRSNSAGTARSYAADAFDQRETLGRTDGAKGASLDGIPSTGLDTSGSNISDMRSVPGANVTPYQKQVDKAKEESNMGTILIVIGSILLGLGLILMLVGKKMMSNPMTVSQGKAMLMIGLMMMLAGAAMLAMGIMKSNSAKDRGEDVAKKSGQEDQGEIMKDCGDSALNKEHCKPRAVRQPKSGVQEDVSRERNAGYTLR